ncbi:UNVERIFIED_CONTAM: hypothetical protein NCL1_16970 [Trichonephila clavipes]
MSNPNLTCRISQHSILSVLSIVHLIAEKPYLIHLYNMSSRNIGLTGSRKHCKHRNFFQYSMSVRLVLVLTGMDEPSLRLKISKCGFLRSSAFH